MKKFILVTILLSLLALSLTHSTSETVDRTLETIEETKDTLGEKIHQGKDYVEEKLEEVADTLKEMYHRVVDRGVEKIDDVKNIGDYMPTTDDARRMKNRATEGASNLYERSKEKLEETYEDIKEEGRDILNRGKENLGNVKEGIKAKTEDLIEGTKDILHRGKERVGDLTEKIGDVKDTIAEKLHMGKQKIEDVVENTKENLDEWTQDAIERYYQAQEGVKDAIKGKLNTGKEKVEDLIESGKEKIQYAKDKLKEGLHIGKNLKDQAEYKLSDIFEDSLGRAKSFAETGKRKFSKGNENLKDLYDQLWLKLDTWYRTGTLNFADFKDLFGDKYDEFSDLISGKTSEAKDKTKEVLHKGKKMVEEYAPDRFREFFEFGWDKIENLINKGNLKVEDINSFLGDKFDVSYIKKLVNNPEQFEKEIDRLKNSVSGFISKAQSVMPDKLGDLFEDSKERAKQFAETGKRVFKGDENLKDLYDQLWLKLDLWYRTGKMNFEDFKDFFGDKFEEFSDLISEKATQAKDKTKEVFHHGKKKVERAPDRFRDLFEVVWDHVENLLTKGSLKTDDLKRLLGEKFDLDYIKRLANNPDEFDKEIDIMKNRISEFINKAQPHIHEHKGFWENLKQTLLNWKNLAADKLTRTPPKDNVRIKTDSEERDKGSSSTEL